MDSEALQRVRDWLEGGCSSWGVPMTDLRKMPDTIEALQAENERLEDAWEIQHGEKVKEREEARLWFEKAQTWKAENAKLRDALFPFAEFHQLGGSMNDPISMWFRVAPFADAAYALQETER